MIYCNSLKSIDLINREKAFKCFATSSLLVGGQLPPLAVMFCFKELLWISRIFQAYIKCSGVCAPSLQGHVGLSVNLNLCKYDFVLP